MKKKVFLLLGIIFLAFLTWRIVLLVMGSGGQTQRFDRPPIAVEVDSVKYGHISDVREFTGTVYPIYRYIIAPKVSGRIIELTKRIGDSVRKDEVIARIDDAEYQQAVLEAEANLKIAEASLSESKSQIELASQELERVQSLQEKGIASPSELDTALTNFNAQQSRLKLAQAQVEQREASLQSARIRLGYTVLVATEPGYIGERFVDEGTLLSPNSPVVSIIGINIVIIQTTIIERDYGLITVGQSAEIEVDAFPSERFIGKVSRIAPMLQESTRVAQMEIEVDNESHMLKPGMFTKVRVIINEKDSAQIVPTRAVIRREGENCVFVVDEDEKIAHFYPVQIGIVAKDNIEILDPKLDKLVVTLGQHLLSEGSPVILPGTEPEAPSARSGGRGKPSPERGTGQ